MGMSAIALEYQARIIALHATASQLRLGQMIALAAVSVAIVAILVLAFLSIAKRAVALPCALLPLPLAIYSGRICKKRNSALLQTLRLETYYQCGVDRLEGRWAGAGVSGEEFAEVSHFYGEGLHVFGEGSLYELLCTCRTEVGRRQLANYLLDIPSLETAMRRQEAVQELRNKSELREQMNLLGDFSFQQSTWRTIVEWLESPVVRIHPAFRALAFGTSISLAVVLLLGSASVFTWSSLVPWIGALLLLNGALGVLFRTRLSRSLEAIRSVGLEIGVLRQGLSLMQAQKFRSALLTQLVESATESDSPACVRKLGL